MVSTTILVVLAHLYGTRGTTPESGMNLVAEAGISAEVLAAAGCSAQNAQTIAADILANTTDREARASALTSLNSVAQQIAAAEAQLRANPRDEDAFRTKIALRQSRTSAIQAVADAEHALRAHSLSTFSESMTSKIEAGAQSRGYVLPPAVRVSLPADSNWRLVARAVRAKRCLVCSGTELPEAYQTIIRSIDGNSQIATATEQYQTNIAAVRAALAQTINP